MMLIVEGGDFRCYHNPFVGVYCNCLYVVHGFHAACATQSVCVCTAYIVWVLFISPVRLLRYIRDPERADAPHRMSNLIRPSTMLSVCVVQYIMYIYIV